MTVYLVRHAAAGIRGSGPDDIRRPLDDAGRVAAAGLADSLRHHPIERVLSSEALRCTQTVEPLAARIGVEVEIHPALLEGASPVATLLFLQELAATEAVVCSHGDVIPGALNGLRAAGVPLDGHRCAKASIWELSVADGVIVGGRYVGTPDRELQV